jgi:hypothetical protein
MFEYGPQPLLAVQGNLQKVQAACCLCRPPFIIEVLEVWILTCTRIDVIDFAWMLVIFESPV